MERDEYFELVMECVEEGEALARNMARAGILEPMYLYHRPSTPGRSGRLFLVRDSAPVPPGVELTTGEGLRSDVPYSSFFQWVFSRARRAPILAY